MTMKVVNLKQAILQAWKERWSDYQWAINMKRFFPRGATWDILNLAGPGGGRGVPPSLLGALGCFGGSPRGYWGVSPSVPPLGCKQGCFGGPCCVLGSPFPQRFSRQNAHSQPFQSIPNISAHSQPLQPITDCSSHPFPTPLAPFWGRSLRFPHGRVRGSAQPGFWDKRSSFELSQERIRVEIG